MRQYDDDFKVRAYDIQVGLHPSVTYYTTSPNAARIEAINEYRHVDPEITYKEFLEMSHFCCTPEDNLPELFGKPMKNSEGNLCFYVASSLGNCARTYNPLTGKILLTHELELEYL